MKKWLAACLLAIALLFVATTAMADHRKANGDNCIGQTFQLLNATENEHTLHCTYCKENFTEAHSIWKEATCMQKALCSACPTRFGDYGPHGWGDWKSNGRGAHTRVCKHNDSHTETKDCTFSVAPCAEPAACTECGAVYSLDHDWGRWTSNGNKTHTHTCKRDSSHTETKSCDIREATCADPVWCRECYSEYGSADPSKHEWMFSRSNGDGTHTRFCAYSHTETRDCSGVSCGETGWCDECHGRYTASHKFNGPWSSNPDKHWRICIYCNEAGSRTSHSFVEQPDARYLKSEATCVSPAVYYRVCSDCGYQTPSTFESGDIDPDNHDLECHDEVKAPTCTEKGWSAYYTCSRCDYTAYQEVDALDHDWNDWMSNGDKTHTRTCKRDPSHTETEACSGVRCGNTGICSVCSGEYTMEHKYDECSWSCDDAEHWRNCIYCNEKVEIASHSFEAYEQTAATCVSPAVYFKVCSDCDYQSGTFNFGDINPDNHDLIHHAGKTATCTEIGWGYGEWSPNSDGTHSADCRRVGCNHTGKTECEKLEYCLRFADTKDYVFEFCPACGEASNGARLTLIEEARATAQRLPRGALVLRIGDLQDGGRVMSVGFGYGGKLTQPTGQVEISLPAALLDGYALMLLDADGLETALPHTLNGDEATFTLDFTADESPARMLRLAPVP